MKKKYVILIVVGLVLVIGGYFSYKGFNLYKYAINANRIQNYKEYYNALKNNKKITIKTTTKADEYLTKDGISIRNDWKNDYSLTIINVPENKYAYTINNEENTHILLSKTKETIFETLSKEDEYYKTFFEKNKIYNLVDLFSFLVKNRDNKPNIFTNTKEIELLHKINKEVANLYGKTNEITFLNGNHNGVMITFNDNSKGITLLENEEYYIIHFCNTDYFTDEYIEDLLKTIIIEKLEEKFTKITINSKEMNIKESDYKTLKGILNNLDYKNTICNTDKVDYIIEIDGKKYFYNLHLHKVIFNDKCAELDGNNLYNSSDILTYVYSNNEMNNIENVKMKIKDGTLTKTGAKIVITDTNETHYEYGLPFRLDVKEKDIWNPVKLIGDATFILPAYIINENNELELNQNWENFYGELNPGEYRLVKSVCVNDGCYEKKYFSVEFIIE